VPESVLTILKFCFLALLYLFLYRVVRVVISEMRAPVPAPPVPVAQPAASAPAPVKSRGRGGLSKVRLLEPAARRGETFALTDELTIGRGGGCGIVLDDSFVSQVHARIYRRDGDVYVEDLGSRNGSLLNGQPLEGAIKLRRGDQVQFGQTIAEAVR
jgi:hypothetical protein